MKGGFDAATRPQEPKCPGVQFVVLEEIEDVTDKVNAAAKPGLSSAANSSIWSPALGPANRATQLSGGAETCF